MRAGVLREKLAAGVLTSVCDKRVLPPRLLSLPWYVPDRCQRHLNEKDQLQRLRVQRQLA